MKDIYLYKHYFIKAGIVFSEMISTPLKATSLLFVVALSDITSGKRALFVLGLLFIIDFITGIFASWVDFKKEVAEIPNTGPKRYLIQSEKLKKSALKFVSYGMMILVAAGIEWAFITPGLKFEPHASLNKMSLTTISIAFLSAIEVYSIVFENLKRMGFDVIKKITSITDTYKKIKNQKPE